MKCRWNVDENEHGQKYTPVLWQFAYIMFT